MVATARTASELEPGCRPQERSSASRQILDGAPALLTIRQVAEALQIGRSTCYRKLISSGVLPVIHLGRQVRVARDSVESFLQAHEGPAW